MSALLSATSIADVDLGAWVRRQGTVLAEYGRATQDSGNVSWLVDAGERRLFVKTAGALRDEPVAGRTPYFDHAGRVRLLRNAVDLAHSCEHPALPRLLSVVESPSGPALVYEAVAGENVHVPQSRRADPASSYVRFAHLPAASLLGVIEQVIDLHVALADVGWVAVDLYDGCLIVDLDIRPATVRVIDLDTYRRGPSVNDMGRMFGSTTFMAPEKYELGAVIDQRTTVFTLCRLAWHFGTRLSEDAAAFCGPAALADVVRRGCAPAPADRFATVAALAAAWATAAGDLL